MAIDELQKIGIYYRQILSFTKIRGQLLEAGSTTTLSHYLNLLDTAGLLAGIEKYSKHAIRKKSSSPKFQTHNTALISAQLIEVVEDAPIQPDLWEEWLNDPLEFVY